jgi:hypothetical protein
MTSNQYGGRGSPGRNYDAAVLELEEREPLMCRPSPHDGADDDADDATPHAAATDPAALIGTNDVTNDVTSDQDSHDVTQKSDVTDTSLRTSVSDNIIRKADKDKADNEEQDESETRTRPASQHISSDTPLTRLHSDVRLTDDVTTFLRHNENGSACVSVAGTPHRRPGSRSLSTETVNTKDCTDGATSDHNDARDDETKLIRRLSSGDSPYWLLKVSTS